MTTGYTDCACRDCFEIAISGDITKPDLCQDCAVSGCEANDGECLCPDAYGQEG